MRRAEELALLPDLILAKTIDYLVAGWKSTTGIPDRGLVNPSEDFRSGSIDARCDRGHPQGRLLDCLIGLPEQVQTVGRRALCDAVVIMRVKELCGFDPVSVPPPSIVKTICE